MLLAQQGLCVANAQREQHASAVEPQAVHARQQAPVLRVQFLRQRQQLGVALGSAQQVGGGHRPGFERHEVQQRGLPGVCAPGGPGGEEVQPEAKAGFQDAPLRCPGPGLRQAAAVQEHLA